MSIRDEDEGFPRERQIPFLTAQDALTAGSNEERRRILTTIQAQQTARAKQAHEAFACDSAPASTRVDKEEFQCRQYALMRDPVCLTVLSPRSRHEISGTGRPHCRRCGSKTCPQPTFSTCAVCRVCHPVGIANHIYFKITV